jgi:hypothetical protein
MKPAGPNDEAGAIPVAQFRAALTQLIGAPVVPQASSSTKAFAPAPKQVASKPRKLR